MPAIWLVTPPGSSEIVSRIRIHTNYKKFSENFFQYTLLGIEILISIIVLTADRFQDPSKNQMYTWQQYRQVDRWLSEKVDSPDWIVQVNNPPAYYAATGRKAVVIPYGDIQTIRTVSDQFGANILILDANHISQFDLLYNQPSSSPSGFRWLGSINQMVIYQIEDQP